MNTLKAEKRSLDVKAKRLRREGYVTGNVFGKEIEGSIPIKIETPAIERLLKKSGKGSQIMLDIGGESHNVLIKEIAYNALKGRVDEIDFQALVKGEAVQSVAEIVLVNHDKLADGVLQQQLEEISYRAVPSALIEKVEIDVAELKLDDIIKVKDLPIASNEEIHLLTDPETVIVTVKEVRAVAEEEPSAEGAEEQAETEKE